MQVAAVYEYQVTARTMASARTWRATAWNGSTFCSVAFNTNICATSSDGITWTDRVMPISDYWQDIASNGSIFVAVGTTANCYTSPDGITWTARALPSSGYITQVEWNGTKFLAIRETTPFFTSSDGITWTSEAAPASGSYGKSLSWNGSVWVIVKHFSTGDIMSSPSGLAGTWVSRQIPIGSNWNAIAVKGSRFCLTSAGSAGTYVSDDGITWTYYNGGIPGNINSIASDGSVFIATSQGSS